MTMYGDYGYFEEDKLGKPYDFRLLKRLYPFTTPYKGLLFAAILLVILITFLNLSIPYITKIAIDRYIVPKVQSPLPSKEGSLNPSQESGQGAKLRYLKVDFSQPEIQKIVCKYEEFFKFDGANAIISFNDLSKLEKDELDILRKNDFTGVGIITAIFIIIILLDFAATFVQVVILEYTAQRIMHDLRMRLFAHIQKRSVSFFTHNPVGRLVTRVTNDIQNMDELFTSVIVFVFKDVFLLIGIAGVLISVNWKLAMVSFIVLPFVALSSIYFSTHARGAFRELRIKTAEINTRFSETIGGIKVIQLFLQEQNNYRQFETLNHEYYTAGMKQLEIFAVFMPVIELLGSVAVSIVILYGGKGVLSEHISLGELVVFISYMKMFFNPIRDIAEKYNIMQNAMASAERIFLILDSKEELPEPTPESQSIMPEKVNELEIDKVSFSYIADETVLKSVSFKVHAGQMAAVVGPTGSGKTSLINLIIRFYDPNSGKIRINGQDIRTINSSDLRTKMALVTQDPFLFSGTIHDNIFQGEAALSEAEIEHIIQASNCKELIDKLPEGLKTELSEGGSSISSGERQLISIGRAFARNPELILLDEATSYIDTETEVKIQQALANLMRNRTSIIVAHRLSTARNADIILVLNRGRIIESGNHEDLMRRKGFYFRLNQLQG